MKFTSSLFLVALLLTSAAASADVLNCTLITNRQDGRGGFVNLDFSWKQEGPLVKVIDGYYFYGAELGTAGEWSIRDTEEHAEVAMSGLLRGELQLRQKNGSASIRCFAK